MIIHRREGQENPERLFMVVRNAGDVVMSQGYNVCAAVRNVASANGYDVIKPATSNLALYLGVVEDASIATQGFGHIQIWGYNSTVYIRTESTDVGGHIEGTRLGPVNNQWYLQSNGHSFEMGPLVLMSRLSQTTFEGIGRVFIRGL